MKRFLRCFHHLFLSDKTSFLKRSIKISLVAAILFLISGNISAQTTENKSKEKTIQVKKEKKSLKDFKEEKEYKKKSGGKKENNEVEEEEENDMYDGPDKAALFQFQITKDPALGYVPYQRLLNAIDHTEELKNTVRSRNAIEPNAQSTPLTWIERGPIYDTVGPSNGNGRGGGTGSTLGGHTSGRMRGFLLDLLNDPSGNTAFASGVAGGIWKTTNFLTGGNAPNWVAINDRFSNMAISSIAQDPTNPQIIYFSTGEPTSNADAVFGGGVWKSTNGGTSFSQLAATSSFIRSFKIGCDAAGNVYLACRTTTTPVNQPNGLYRSTNGGTSWTDITPNDLTSNRSCTDFEFTASGNLNAVFGYLGTVVNHRYTTAPSTVAIGTWSSGAGFRTSNTAARRTEMAVVGNVLYAVTVASSDVSDSCYKSTDGGVNWTKQNSIVLPAGLAAQGWYNISLTINPSNTNEIVTGGLDAYRSIDAGVTWTRMTYWVSSAPYVHADHHYAQYWIAGGETRLIMCTDGGVFYSADNGATFISKNRNLGIKQFYSAAIHPDAGSPYLLAGAQDNGTHQLKNPGLSYSIEVTGGDGCIVHINQQNPLIQFGSYVYNQYRRTVDGGVSWASLNLSGSTGQFVNPFDYDDAQNIMYCGNSAGTIRRWDNANTTNTSIVYNVTNMTGSLLSAKYSPYTANRLFFGTNNGKLFRLDNANAPANGGSVAAIDITGASFPAGTIICVNTGTDDNNLVATYSNYGVNNVWVTTNGGTSWSAVDGDLPDMPVRWAMFEPGTNAKLFLATEAGIYTTTNINGASTQWLPETTFPTVATYMLKMRASDSTIVAGTHGRGLWTSKIPAIVLANPTVTINQAAAQPDPTSLSPINFTVVFSEPVTGFTAAGVNLAGTAGATTKVVTGSGATYNIAVSGMTVSGTVIATVSANAATGTINILGNQASTSTDNTVTYNVPAVPPTVTINQAAAQLDPTSVSPINFTVVFSEPVTGFTAAGVNLSGTAGATTKVVTGGPTTYNVAVSGMTISGTVIANVPANAATGTVNVVGNASSTSTDNTVTYNLVTTNDVCSGALPIACGQTINGTTVGATLDVVPTCVTGLSSGPSVWYTFVGDGQNTTLSLCGSGFDTKIGVFTGTCAALVCVTGNDDFCGLQSQVTLPSINGTTYYVMVTGFATNAGAFTLTRTCTPPLIANDACGNALPIACGQTINGTTVGATSDAVPTCATTLNTAPGVWYTFVGNGLSNTLSLCGSGYDTKIGIFTGTCAALVCAVGNDDFCGLQSQVTFTAVNGTTYYVLVTGFSTNEGVFTLARTCVCPTLSVDPVSNQGVCNGAATTAVTFTGAEPSTVYTWTNDNTSFGLAASGTGNIASFTATNAGTTPLTATITVTPTYAGCPNGPSATFTITVNPTPQVDQPANQTVCNGTMTAPVNFTTTVPGTTYAWSNNTPSIGLAASGTGNIAAFTATNATTLPVTGTITVTPTIVNPPSTVSTSGFLNNNANALVTFNFRNTNSTPVTITGIESICSTNGQKDVTAFFKTSAINGLPGAISVANGWNSFGTAVITGIANTTTTTTQPFMSGLSLVVPPGATYGIAIQAVNQGTTTAAMRYSTITAGPFTFTTAGCDLISGANISYGGVAAPGAPTFTPRAFLGKVNFTNSCAGPSKTFNITVNPTPTITCPANITTASDVGVCNKTVTYIPTVTGTPVPTLSYVLTGATTGSGAGSGSGLKFNVGVTTITITATNTCATVTCSFTITVTDSQLPTITTQPANRTVCAGSNATFTVVAVTAPSAGGPIAYQWQLWNGSTWNNIAGATAATLTLNSVTQTMNTNSYRVQVIGLCTTITSGFATLYVNPLPTINLTTSIPPALLPTQVLTITATTAPSGGSYVWFKNGVVIPGATGNTLSGLTVSDIGTYRVVYTDGNGCVAISANIDITGQPSNNLYVYPVPNQGVFNVRFYNQANEQVTVRVFDAKGAEVYSRKILTTIPYTTINVDLSTNQPLANGTYVVDVRGADGRLVGSRKIIVYNR